MKRYLAALTLILLSLAFLGGCEKRGHGSASSEPVSSDAPPSLPPVTAADYPVTVNGVTFQSAPRRVVVLSPSLAEIAADLSYGALLVGRSAECDHPAYVAELPEVGRALLPDSTVIAELRPDLLLMQQEPSVDFRGWAEENRIPLLVIPPAAGFEGLKSLYDAVGQALGGKESGAAAAASLFMQVEQGLRAVEAAVGERKTPGLYAADRGGSVATGDTVLHRILTSAGVENTAAEGTGWVPPDGAAASAQVLFCPAGWEEIVKASAVFKGSPAVKNGKVYGVDITLTERQGLRLVEAARWIAKQLYPDLPDEGETLPPSSQTDV